MQQVAVASDNIRSDLATSDSTHTTQIKQCQKTRPEAKINGHTYVEGTSALSRKQGGHWGWLLLMDSAVYSRTCLKSFCAPWTSVLGSLYSVLQYKPKQSVLGSTERRMVLHVFPQHHHASTILKIGTTKGNRIHIGINDIGANEVSNYAALSFSVNPCSEMHWLEIYSQY